MTAALWLADLFRALALAAAERWFPALPLPLDPCCDGSTECVERITN